MSSLLIMLALVSALLIVLVNLNRRERLVTAMVSFALTVVLLFVLPAGGADNFALAMAGAASLSVVIAALTCELAVLGMNRIARQVKRG